MPMQDVCWLYQRVYPLFDRYYFASCQMFHHLLYQVGLVVILGMDYKIKIK